MVAGPHTLSRQTHGVPTPSVAPAAPRKGQVSTLKMELAGIRCAWCVPPARRPPPHTCRALLGSLTRCTNCRISGGSASRASTPASRAATIKRRAASVCVRSQRTYVGERCAVRAGAAPCRAGSPLSASWIVKMAHDVHLKTAPPVIITNLAF
jgi:hypothetical protein